MAHVGKLRKPCLKPAHPGSRPGLAGCKSSRVPRCPVCHADSGTIEKPADVIDFSKLTGSVKKRPPYYKVMLHNDNVNRREYVVQALLKVVDGLTMEDALEVMHEAHLNDVALVIVSPQEQAEEYVTGLRRNGLTSTMEPGSGGGSSPGGDSEQ